jgi:hypothetical protein
MTKKGSEVLESSEVDNIPQRETPTPDWTFEELTQYARSRLADSVRLEDQAIRLGRRSVMEFYEAGQALSLIRDKLKPQKNSWVTWQRESGLSTTHVNRAIRLFEKAEEPDDLTPFATVRLALEHYGIEKPRKAKPENEWKANPPSPPPAQEREDEDMGKPEDDLSTGGEEKPPTQTQAVQVPCVEGRMQVKRTSISIEAGKLRLKRVLPLRCPVRIVPRWRAELKLVIDAGQAVLVLPDLEVADAV